MTKPQYGDLISPESFKAAFRNVRNGQAYGHVPPGEDAFVDAVANLLCHHWKEDAAAIRRECAKKYRARTEELIHWIESSIGPHDGMLANLAARRKVADLRRELDEVAA